jgi:proteic killer suppression protein
MECGGALPGYSQTEARCMIQYGNRSDGSQEGGEGLTTSFPSFYRVSRPLPTTGRGCLILSSADGTLQACQRLRWRGGLLHERPHVSVDKCDVTGYTLTVKIRNFLHKGVQRLYLDDNAKGVPPDTVEKLRKMFAFLDVMSGVDEVRALTAWKPHTLTGDRKGTVSLSVTRNRRLTFRVDAAEEELYDVNLEDYH